MANEALDREVTPLPNATNRVVAVFDSPGAAEEAARALEGVAHVQDIDVICGVSGAEQVDVDGHNHGVLGKIVRASHRSTDSVEMGQLDQELRAGHCVVSFRSDLLKDLEPAVGLLADNGGRYIHHFGAVLVTQLRP